MRKWAGITAIAVVAIIFIWFSQQVDEPIEVKNEKSTGESVLKIAEIRIAKIPPADASVLETNNESTEIDSDNVDLVAAVPVVQTAAEAGLNAWDIAQGPLSDDDYYHIVAFLKSDKNFLNAVVAEFQGETDPRGLKRLASLLSEVDDPSITTAAINMVASGNPLSESAALQLLGKIQHRDSEAQLTILNVIETRTEAPVLVSALNAIAVADQSSPAEQRIDIVNRISPLTQHHEAKVRRQSYITLFRWAADVEHLLPQLRAGLSDSDEQIRRVTALSFAKYPQSDEQTKLELFSMLNDQAESPRNRKAAASALNKLTLLAGEKTHVKAVLSALSALR